MNNQQLPSKIFFYFLDFSVTGENIVRPLCNSYKAIIMKYHFIDFKDQCWKASGPTELNNTGKNTKPCAAPRTTTPR